MEITHLLVVETELTLRLEAVRLRLEAVERRLAQLEAEDRDIRLRREIMEITHSPVVREDND